MNDTGDLSRVPASCGRVAVGCAEVAGIVQSVNESSEKLRTEHTLLAQTVAELTADQEKVAQATDEARLLSANALERLAEGTGMIQSSLDRITNLLDLVEALSTHVTGFAAAIDQVRQCSQDIDRIAETTNILALNATIEAMRAGEAGRTFAVVAGEVKGLASDTRKATEEIGTVVDRLTDEAAQVIERIEVGAEASRDAKSSVASIDTTISNVTELIREVDGQNEQIARSTGTISVHVESVHDVLEAFAGQSRTNEEELARSVARMGELELTACDMFNQVVHAGLSPEDTLFVAKGREMADRAQTIARLSIEAGEMQADTFFDRDYRHIAGTDPECFSTIGMGWAEKHWQPILDELAASDKRIGSTVLLDENGHLFAHMSRYSQRPTGDIEQDTLFCRKGRIFGTEMNLKAGRSKADYIMSVYRRDDETAEYAVWRSVYLPVEIDGRRWGNLQISYQL